MNIIRMKAWETRDYWYDRAEKIGFGFQAEAEMVGEEGTSPALVVEAARNLFQKVIDPALKQQVMDFAARSSSFRGAMAVVKPQITRKYETILISREENSGADSSQS